MKAIQFKWNKQKSVTNEQKHYVSFQEASTVFSDESAIDSKQYRR